jgi:Zinc finger, C2H2 type
VQLQCLTEEQVLALSSPPKPQFPVAVTSHAPKKTPSPEKSIDLSCDAPLSIEPVVSPKDVSDATLSIKKPTLNVFSCHYCGCTFMTLNNCNLHVKYHEMQTPGFFTCLRKECQQIFCSTSALQEHSKTHKIEKFTCEECGKFYINRKTLMSHIQRHSAVRSFRCQFPGCSYAGKLRRDVYMHAKNVHNFLIFSCDICGRCLKGFKNLQEHVKRHQSGKQGVYKCTFHHCKFTSENLIDHMISHLTHTTNISQILWSCNVCGEHFPSETSLDDHTKSCLPAAENVPLEQVFIKTEELQQPLVEKENCKKLETIGSE